MTINDKKSIIEMKIESNYSSGNGIVVRVYRNRFSKGKMRMDFSGYTGRKYTNVSLNSIRRVIRAMQYICSKNYVDNMEDEL